MPHTPCLGRSDNIKIVVPAQKIALQGKMLHREGCKAGTCLRRMLAVELREQFDPEDGDGLVVAAGRGVLAADGYVVGADAGAHAVDRGGLVEGADVAGAGEDVGGMGPASLGQSAVFEGGEEGIQAALGGWKRVVHVL